MNDAWLLIGIFAFAFVLWLSTGGPSRPISFAGPYITPITDVDDTQTGYGSGIDLTDRQQGGVWSLKSILGRFEGKLSDAEIGVVSPLEGAVRIVSGAGGPSAAEVNQEYVTVRAATQTDITGWRIVSGKSGATVFIGQGAPAPRESGGAALTNIVLDVDDEAIITTGRSPIIDSFRENTCIGYLDSDGLLVPSLPKACPAPKDELGTFYSAPAAQYDECRAYVSTLSRCTIPESTPRTVSASCRAFVEERLNYTGCVTGHFADDDFAGDTWRVYLNQPHELWRSDHEILKLLDREGRTVDIYSY